MLPWTQELEEEYGVKLVRQKLNILSEKQTKSKRIREQLK
jgi:hypothetical protein